MVDLRVAARVAVPLLIMGLMVFLSGHVFSDPRMARMIPDEYGPAFWPTWILWGVGVGCALWAGREVWVARRVKQAPPPVEEKVDDGYDHRLAWVGMAVVFAYGWLIQQIGFPLATFLFLMTWCVIGGFRKPLNVLLVGGIGTVVLLYVFVLLAKMPLDRGYGAFDGFSVAVYRTLGIY